MNIKFHNKKVVFKIIATISLITIFFGFLFNIDKFSSNASAYTVEYEDVIKILEVGPGNVFRLGENKLGTSTGEYNNKKYEITHMSMPQFISMVDDLSGSYDIIAITNETVKKDNTAVNCYWGDYAYRNYTNAFTQKIDKIKVSVAGSTNGLVEYYSANDITNRRAEKVKEMISSGQLVYIDNSIFNNRNTNDYNKYNASDSKLYKNFYDLNGSKFKKVSSSDITLEKMLQEYDSMEIANKRPKVSQLVRPNDDSSTSVTTGDVNKRNMTFKFTANLGNSEDFTAKLYLDYNGDGIFTDDENVQNYSLTGEDGYKEYSITYRLDKFFIGYLDWEIEIVRDNGVKTNILSNSTFKTVTGKKLMKVLQVYPDTITVYEDVEGRLGQRFEAEYSSTNGLKSKKGLLLDSDEFKEKLAKATDYDIQVTTIKATDFNNQYGTTENKKKLNGNFDMVIFGFGDNYGEKYDFSDDCINEIKSFISTGQSVMFTHDTMSLQIADQVVGSSQGASNLTQDLRDVVGQNSYYTINSEGNRVYSKTTMGQTALVTNGGDNSINWGENLYKRTRTKTVTLMNKAQITQYPYDLSSSNAISVATTHTQWYQLDLEDSEIVPWYNLVTDKDYNQNYTFFDSGDATNFYYTYSKGNITYSGTGHSTGVENFPGSELELFVNTIIKAARGANTAPTISSEIKNSDNATVTLKDGDTVNVAYNENGYNINSIFTDPDKNDNVTISVNGSAAIQGSLNFDAPCEEARRIVVGANNSEVNQIGKPITITVKAVDKYDAKDEQTYTIIPVRSTTPDPETTTPDPDPDDTNLSSVEHGLYLGLNEYSTDINLGISRGDTIKTVLNGGTIQFGATIKTAGVAVSDANMVTLYYKNSDVSGDIYFRYQLNDGEWTSILGEKMEATGQYAGCYKAQINLIRSGNIATVKFQDTNGNLLENGKAYEFKEPGVYLFDEGGSEENKTTNKITIKYPSSGVSSTPTLQYWKLNKNNQSTGQESDLSMNKQGDYYVYEVNLNEDEYISEFNINVNGDGRHYDVRESNNKGNNIWQDFINGQRISDRDCNCNDNNWTTKAKYSLQKEVMEEVATERRFNKVSLTESSTIVTVPATTITLTVDNNINVSNAPRLYKINQGGLEHVGDLEVSTSNGVYTYDLPAQTSAENYVVLYTGQLNTLTSNGTRLHTNKISAYNKEAEVKVNIRNTSTTDPDPNPNDEWPDLF